MSDLLKGTGCCGDLTKHVNQQWGPPQAKPSYSDPGDCLNVIWKVGVTLFHVVYRFSTDTDHFHSAKTQGPWLKTSAQMLGRKIQFCAHPHVTRCSTDYSRPWCQWLPLTGVAVYAHISSHCLGTEMLVAAALASSFYHEDSSTVQHHCRILLLNNPA